MAHPKLYWSLHDDEAPNPEEWVPTIHDLISYMLVFDEGEELIGLYMVSAHSGYLWELHDCFLPQAWGRKARRAAREFLNWIWAESKCQVLIGYIVESNIVALNYAISGGFEIWGKIPDSFLKDGRMQDQFLVGMKRPGARPSQGEEFLK